MTKLATVGALALALGLCACGPQAAAPEADSKRVNNITITERGTGASDPREVEVPVVDGRPMWTANRSQTAEENAKEAFDRNGEAFGAKDVDEFVRMAHAFTAKPPAGVQKLERANGDTLLYDPKANVFAVVTKDGAPRTMFKPDEGAAYWEEQKGRETSRSKAG